MCVLSISSLQLCFYFFKNEYVFLFFAVFGFILNGILWVFHLSPDVEGQECFLDT